LLNSKIIISYRFIIYVFDMELKVPKQFISVKMFMPNFTIPLRFFETLLNKKTSRILNILNQSSNHTWRQLCHWQSLHFAYTLNDALSTILCTTMSISRLHSYDLCQNYWVFWNYLSSGILGTREHNVSKAGSVSVLKSTYRNVVFSSC
jgi:hypothetical protein